MIARSDEAEETPRWQDELRDAYRDPVALLAGLGLTAAAVGLATAPATAFPFRVTRAFARRMRAGDANDPLLMQVLPSAFEAAQVAGFGPDPVGELARRGDDALLQKYAGRALLILTGACAIHCRYCFRREFPYESASGQQRLDLALASLAAEPSVSEVILSGGDPLMLTDRRLGQIYAALAPLAHLGTVRIHSRLPIVLPARVTDELLAVIAGTRFNNVLVVHANHPREIDLETAAALRRCRAAGITVLNQAVLLSGINDDPAILAELCRMLFDNGVLPYYVHALDRVRGAAHFEVTETRARQIEGEMRACLPGYLMPRFVREVAGAAAKLPLHELLPG